MPVSNRIDIPESAVAIDLNFAPITGVNGKVYKGTYGGATVAVKMPLFKAGESEQTQQQKRDDLAKDSEFLRSVNSSLFPVYKGEGRRRDPDPASVVQTSEAVYTEFLGGQSLARMGMAQARALDGVKKKKILKDCLLALKTLHGLGISHGDIQTGNVMFDTATNVTKVIDFGKATRRKVGNDIYGVTAEELAKSMNDDMHRFSFIAVFLDITDERLKPVLAKCSCTSKERITSDAAWKALEDW
ncbi:hypothetical protein BGX34_004757 [Mortierella sp. NVP85]|nr:hypothetical protein BGX34_004757 [Mortierella sp. NVP85]